MNYNIVYRDDYRDEVEEDYEDFEPCNNSRGCSCDDCEDARRYPKAPDYDSLPLFKAMNYKP